MAIRPDDARKLTKAELDTVSEIEKKIDAKLALDWNGGELLLTVEVPKLSKRAQDNLANRYIYAGWRCFIAEKQGQSDGKDVYYLQLKFSEAPVGNSGYRD